MLTLNIDNQGRKLCFIQVTFPCMCVHHLTLLFTLDISSFTFHDKNENQLKVISPAIIKWFTI